MYLCNKLLYVCRNGVSMGQAYDNVLLGPGLAYVPGVSLSMGENICANFGGTPLRSALHTLI